MSPRITLTTFAALLFAATCSAATFTVNNNGNTPDINPGDGLCRDASNRCTLRAAFMEAEALAGPDTINLQANATYTIPTAHDIYAGVPLVVSEIIVNGNGATIRRDPTPGTPDFRLFYVSSGGGNLTLRRLTIMNGNANGGGGILLGGIVTLDSCAIVGNRAASGTGGGVLNLGWHAHRLKLHHHREFQR